MLLLMMVVPVLHEQVFLDFVVMIFVIYFMNWK